MLKRIVKRYVLGMAARPVFQPLFEQMLRVSLLGMNVGAGSDVDSSGEDAFLSAVARMYPRGDGDLVVLDGGANVGDYTRATLQYLGARARVFAFEPSAETFRALSRNVGSLPHVTLVNCGLGERAESRTLFSNEDGSGIASVYARDLRHLATTLDHQEQIELRAIDDVIEEHGLDRVHLLKLDIEGHELSALRGAQRALAAGRIDLIQFEFGGCNIDSRSYLRDFRDLLGSRYVLHRMVRGGLRALPRYAELQEIFVTTNFVAVRSELADALQRAL